MQKISEQSIIAGIRSFLDQAGRAIGDNDRQGAIDSLNDALNAVKTLQGLLRLPPACHTESPERTQPYEKSSAT